MLRAPSATVEVLSVESIKGFIFEVEVDKKDVEFMNLIGASFVKDVTQIVLKFSIIEPNEYSNSNSIELPKLNMVEGEGEGEEVHAYKKQTDSSNNFLEEAKTQQNVWLRSILSGREEICPSVAGFSFLTYQAARQLFDSFSPTSSSDVKRVIEYLLYILQKYPTTTLGLIVSPKVEECVTLESQSIHLANDVLWLELHKHNNNNKNQNHPLIKLEDIYGSVIGKILQMFYEEGIIHYDLHRNNILVNKDTGKVTIIDFGRVFYMFKKKPHEDPRLTALRESLSEIFIKLRNRLDTFLKTRHATPELKHTIIEYIQSIDALINGILFFRTTKLHLEKSQMHWYTNFVCASKFPHFHEDILIKAFNVFLKSQQSRNDLLQEIQLNRHILKNMIRKGLIISLDKPVHFYKINSWPKLVAPSDLKQKEDKGKDKGKYLLFAPSDLRRR